MTGVARHGNPSHILAVIISLALMLAIASCKGGNAGRDAGNAVSATHTPVQQQQGGGPSDVSAVAASPERSMEDICRSLTGLDFPASDRPSPTQKAGLKPGDAKRYYYGIGVEKDHVKARHAAFLELDESYGAWFSGNAILMMIYANGFGVERNANLATKLACAEEGAPAEMKGRVQHLQNLPVRAQLPPFDLCDDATSGMLMGACETLATEREVLEIEARIKTIAAAWPEEQKAALARLREHAEAYWELHASREVDLTGTDRDGVRARTKVEQLRGFATTLEAFARAPHADSGARLTQADADLNKAYKESLARDLSYTTINAEGIRATELAWLKYRDAWAALGPLRYPAVEGAAWKAWASRERSRELSGIGN